MSSTFFCSDHHLGHEGSFKTLKAPDGSPLRPFSGLEEMHEAMIDRHNATVGKNDRVYMMGDVAISRKYLPLISRFNGKKVLVRGNHDIFRLSDYTPYFEDIRACKVYPAHGIIVTHIPIHPSGLENRITINIHGHTHANNVTIVGFDDPRYINLCVEKTNYTPVSLEDVLLMVEIRREYHRRPCIK